MSNSKKISYDMEEPAFLRRMRQQAAGGGRQERYIAPRNKKTAVDDDDDAPAYVLEGGRDTISRAEFEAMAGGESEEALASPITRNSAEESPTATEEKQEKEANGLGKEAAASSDKNLTEIGGNNKKKRKAAKIIGGEDNTGGDDNADAKANPEKAEKNEKKKAGKSQKRRVKLSFDAD